MSKGFETHPLEHLFFFELSSFRVADLSGKRIRVQHRANGEPFDLVYLIHAWSNPFRSGLLAMKAHGQALANGYPVGYTLIFDRERASNIRRATNQDYDFEADLGELKALEQESHIWALVKADFDREKAKIGPVVDVPLRHADPASVRAG